MIAPRYEVVSSDGHYLIRTTDTGRPICLVYAHYCGGLAARRRAEKLIEALNG